MMNTHDAFAWHPISIKISIFLYIWNFMDNQG